MADSDDPDLEMPSPKRQRTESPVAQKSPPHAPRQGEVSAQTHLGPEPSGPRLEASQTIETENTASTIPGLHAIEDLPHGNVEDEKPAEVQPNRILDTLMQHVESAASPVAQSYTEDTPLPAGRGAEDGADPVKSQNTVHSTVGHPISAPSAPVASSVPASASEQSTVESTNLYGDTLMSTEPPDSLRV